MKLPIYQIDAFADCLFAGNPAAVVLLQQWLPDKVLAAIARENNLSETAFVIPGTTISQLRWFTPAVEIDLCGHATLATADVLLREIFPEQAMVRFSTRSGELAVRREGELLRLDFPARPAAPVALDDAVVDALGARPQAAYRARDLMLVFEHEAEVAALRPDFRKLGALAPGKYIATAPGDAVDFVSRFFAPAVGVDEDPVTGSAHCTLIPYWAERLGKNKLRARQISVRGGSLFCEHLGERVGIAGRAVEYLRGEIGVPE